MQPDPGNMWMKNEPASRILLVKSNSFQIHDIKAQICSLA